MEKRVIVVSLGGSQIIKDNEINFDFLKKFREIVLKNQKKYKFVIVCGGGSVARMYIDTLKKNNSGVLFQSFAGISVTRTNARFMSYLFNHDPKKGIPHTMIEVKNRLEKKDIIFCGALEYRPNETSDTTSARIASELKAEFINITNVDGLYDKNPKEYKNAKLIKNISWNDFFKIARKIPFKPGQHFVLDQKSSKIIKDGKIKTCIIGNDLTNFEKFLENKEFIGTIIQN
jgi:uridylate kinase